MSTPSRLLRSFARCMLLGGGLGLVSAAHAAPPPQLEQGRQEFNDMAPAILPQRIPDTTAGRQFRWVMEALNSGLLGDGKGDEAQAAKTRFTPEFLIDVPIRELAKELREIRDDAFDGTSAVVVRIAASRDDNIAAVIGTPGGKTFLDVLLWTDDKAGTIAALRFTKSGGMTAGEPAGKGGDKGGGGGEGGGKRGGWDDVGDSLDDLPGQTSFGAYEIKPRDPQRPDEALELLPIAGSREEHVGAIGSTFKLYVLGALAEEIAAGTLAWETKIAVRDEWKSLPSGTMQLVGAGVEHPVSTYALNMISISDNTAADHLIQRLGRERVERYTNAINDNTTKNTPFLTTREAFWFKLNDEPTVQEEYADADEPTRRAMLAPDGDAGRELPSLDAASQWGEPRAINTIEWFASPKDCCRAFARLRELEQLPGMAPLGKILRKNPGLAFDSEVWKSAAFKGGSEPGVINGTWLLQRADDRWFTISVTWNDAQQAVDNEAFIAIVERAVQILAREGGFRETQTVEPPPEGEEDPVPEDPASPRKRV
jgi:hypothetical protein